ncbi:AAA family ATPase [Cellvibrio sp. OA-2007]|uniref:AAA family ATPase n=1 Tax=Cellvibrio sp. OA-2007 TaxID=529823 RepID=UPI0007834A2C|nr:AAA family ATPase [Cellvibrio sp. OA-2007]
MDNLIRIPEAVYKKQGLPEYDSNPFIAALPLINDRKTAIASLVSTPDFSEEELDYGPDIRVHAMQRLITDFFQPQAQHINLETRISILIRQGYIGRNPATSDFIKHLNNGYDRIVNKDISLTTRTDVNITANSFSVIGPSGCGKTKALEKILKCYDKVIYHPGLKLTQIPWLKLECPSNGSLKQLCKSFFVALDKRLGSKYKSKYGKARAGVDEMIAEMAHLANLHAIGVLIIDEIQNLSVHRSGGEAPMMNFFVTLVNDIGVPVILVGTPKARRLLAKDFSQARRGSGLGSVMWQRLNQDTHWEKLTDLMWTYQWLHRKAELSDEIRNVLYDCSQGIIDILVKLFVLSQWRAMLIKTEELSAGLIQKTYQDEFKAVHPMLAALRSNNPDALERFGDLKMPDIDNKMIQAFEGEIPIEQNEAQELEAVDEQREKVKKLLKVAMELGLEHDIAVPLIEGEVAKNPDLNVVHLMSRISTLMIGTTVPEKKKGASKKPKINDWQQHADTDMRKMYFSKGETTMHETLLEKGIICSIADYLKAG